MKMIRRTRQTSTSGVTLMSLFTSSSFLLLPCIVGVRCRCIRLGRLLVPPLLEHVADELRGHVVHVDDEALYLAGVEVEEHGGGNGDEQTDRGVDERLGDAGADDVHAAAARQLAERVDDADDRAEEA